MTPTALFLTILQMSLAASIAMAIVLAVRLLLNKLHAPFWSLHILWLLILLRLLCPLFVDSNVSLPSLPLIDKPIMQAERLATPMAQPSIETTAAAPANPDASITTPQTQNDILSPTTNAFDWFTIATIFWLVGALTIVLYGVLSNIRLKRHIRHAARLHDNTYESANIDAPFVYGLFRPRIYLPISRTEKETLYILAHEQAHIRRLDHLVKPLFFLAVAIHWFNPLVWLSFSLMSRDMETACDAHVIKQLGEQTKKEYGRLLFSFATERSHWGAGPLGFGENSVSQRIKSVLSYKKPGAIIVIVATVLCAATVVVAAGSPYNNEQTQINNRLAQILQDPTVIAYVGTEANANVDTTNSPFYGQSAISDQLIHAFGDTGHWEKISNTALSSDNRFSENQGNLQECFFIADDYNKKIHITKYEDGTLINLIMTDENPQINQTYFVKEDIYSDIAALIQKYDKKTLIKVFANDPHMIQIGGSFYPIDTTSLNLSDIDLGDCTVLAQFQQLQSLGLTGVTISNSAKLSSLTQLKHLVIEGVDIPDISFIQSLTNLESLSISFMDLVDLSPIAKLKQLNYLCLTNMPVTDISPLQELGKLTYLNLQFTDVSNIAPLKNLTKLTTLNLEVTRVNNIEALSNLYQMRELHLSNTKVEDMSPLQKLVNLTWLDLQATAIRDIAAVSSLSNLETLTLSGTKVSDLSPLTELDHILYLGLPSSFKGKDMVTQLQQNWSGRDGYADANINFFDAEYREKSEITAW